MKIFRGKKVLDGDRTKVRQLNLEPIDLQIFKGRFSPWGNKSRG